MKLARAMMRDPSGSVNNEKRESDVNTLAVSSVFPPPPFLASIEKTANVKIGDATGETYAIICQLRRSVTPHS
jgi:hypothetical protein